MNTSPTVVVRKSGFLGSLAIGFFTFLTGAVVCSTAVAFYGLRIVDQRSDDVLQTVRSVFTSLPEWRAALPPALSDALEDQRDPAYRTDLDVTARIVPGRGRQAEPQAIVEITNQGERTVSLLSVRVTLEDDDGRPLESFSTYAVTPLAFGERDDEWRGPLLPGSTRRLALDEWSARGATKAAVEVNELRVWNESRPVEAASPQTAKVE